MSNDRARVIVGVDGSEDALRAVHYARGEAEIHDADLLVVHGVDDAVLAGSWGSIYDPSILEESGQQAVDEAVAQAIAEGFPPERVRGHVLVGNPASVLLRSSEEGDRIIVGRRANPGLERIFVGSTSMSVASGARCPVMMISAQVNPDETGGLGRIGVGVGADGPIRGTGAMRMAFEEAAARGAALSIIHVVQPPPARLFGGRTKLSPEQAEQAEQAAREQIGRAMEPLVDQYPGVEVDVQVEVGNAADVLIQRSAHLDLLVIGAHSGGLGLALGATVRAIMAHARCPVGIKRATGQA